jgi:dienelactone hydrolase
MRLFSLTAIAVIAFHISPANAQEINADGTVTPLIATSNGDYAAARATFVTRLLREGPSPQRIPMPDAPKNARAIDFPSGTLTLRAWVGIPAGRVRPRPVVIFLHGGFGFGQEDFDMAAAYRAAGFVLVTPILRGENGQPGSFSLFYNEVDDVIALADFLRRQSYVDPNRIYLAGHSVGGTIALLTAMTDRRFRAVASFSGSPDQMLFTRYGMRATDIPFDPTDAREIQMRSPLAYAASLKVPTRLYYGSEEGFFKLSTDRLAAIAAKARLDVKAQAIAGTHMSAIPVEIAASIAFFRTH